MNEEEGFMVTPRTAGTRVSVPRICARRGGGGRRLCRAGSLRKTHRRHLPAGCRSRRPVHDQELLSRSKVLDRPAIRPLQYAPPAHRHVDARQPRRSLGRLHARLPRGEDCQPLRVQDSRGALQRADGRGEESRRPDDPHAPDAAELGRTLSARLRPTNGSGDASCRPRR